MHAARGHDSEQEGADQEVVDNARKRTKDEYSVRVGDDFPLGKVAGGKHGMGGILPLTIAAIGVNRFLRVQHRRRNNGQKRSFVPTAARLCRTTNVLVHMPFF